MVTYVYRCRECKILFEKRYPIGEQPPVLKCPKCGAESKRYLGRGGVSGAIHFVGMGWAGDHRLHPLDPDPRNNPLYFDDLLEDKDRGPKHFFTSSNPRGPQ